MKEFKNYKREQYVSQAFRAWFWTVLGTVLPLLIGSVILFTYSESSKIIGFIDRGDFCLYSAGLMSSSLFVLSDNKDNNKGWPDAILHPITFILIIVAAALYCAIYIGGDLLREQIKINISGGFVRYTSYFLIISSIIIAYRALLIDFKSRPPQIDVIKDAEDNVQNIMNQLGN